MNDETQERADPADEPSPRRLTYVQVIEMLHDMANIFVREQTSRETIADQARLVFRSLFLDIIRRAFDHEASRLMADDLASNAFREWLVKGAPIEFDENVARQINEAVNLELQNEDVLNRVKLRVSHARSMAYRLRASGKTWLEIAVALGTHEQRAKDLHRAAERRVAALRAELRTFDPPAETSSDDVAEEQGSRRTP